MTPVHPFSLSLSLLMRTKPLKCPPWVTSTASNPSPVLPNGPGATLLTTALLSPRRASGKGAILEAKRLPRLRAGGSHPLPSRSPRFQRTVLADAVHAALSSYLTSSVAISLFAQSSRKGRCCSIIATSVAHSQCTDVLAPHHANLPKPSRRLSASGLYLNTEMQLQTR